MAHKTTPYSFLLVGTRTRHSHTVAIVCISIHSFFRYFFIFLLKRKRLTISFDGKITLNCGKIKTDSINNSNNEPWFRLMSDLSQFSCLRNFDFFFFFPISMMNILLFFFIFREKNTWWKKNRMKLETNAEQICTTESIHISVKRASDVDYLIS